LTIDQALQRSASELRNHGIDSARLDAELLLARRLGVDRATLLARGRDSLSDDVRTALDADIARRVAGDPVAYITGTREFYGHSFRVTPDVLVPRPETELLVDRALALQPRRMLEIGTGSGCIAVACALALPELEIVAIDVDDDALAVARANAKHHGVDDRIEFRLGDLFEPVADVPPVDVLACNPPYVETSFDVQTTEPRHAIYAGADGLDVIRPVVAGGCARLRVGGTLLCEIGDTQADAVIDLAGAHFAVVAILRDLADRPRVLEAKR